MLARLARQAELAVAMLELTLPQYRVLGILDDGREAASVLADKLAVSRPSVTGVIDGLVSRGLVERASDPADRRRVGLELTREGRRLLAAADAEVERRLSSIAAYGDSRTAAAFAGLEAWQQALDAAVAARVAAAKTCGPESAEPAPRAAGVAS